MKNPFSKKPASSSPSLWLAFRSSKAFTTFVLGYAVFADQFIFTCFLPIANYALSDRIEVKAEKVQFWLSTLLAIYGLAMFIASPIFGWCTDRIRSRKTPFLSGITISALSTILLWLTNDLPLAILGRVLQGVAAAIVSVTTMAIIIDTVGEEKIGEYMGYITIALNLGTLLGPVSSGLILEHLGYDWVYIIGLVILGCDFVLRLVMFERVRTQRGQLEVQARRQSMDQEAGIEKSPSSQASGTAATSQRPQQSRPDDKTPAKREWPAIITLLGSPRFLAALWGIFIQAVIGDTFKASLPVYCSKKFD